jgi:esterase/lipase superfamily enzyme
MTLYASAADRALVASRELAGGIPRASDVPADGPIILPNVETIDVTAMGEDVFGLNHSVFAVSRDVMEDISVLLRLNLPSPRLTQIRPVPDPPAATLIPIKAAVKYRLLNVAFAAGPSSASHSP